jgi:hypothetical protein
MIVQAFARVRRIDHVTGLPVAFLESVDAANALGGLFDRLVNNARSLMALLGTVRTAPPHSSVLSPPIDAAQRRARPGAAILCCKKNQSADSFTPTSNPWMFNSKSIERLQARIDHLQRLLDQAEKQNAPDREYMTALIEQQTALIKQQLQLQKADVSSSGQ